MTFTPQYGNDCHTLRQTEEKLEEVFRLLIDRYGSATSLGHVLARVVAIRLRHQGEEVTLARVSRETGIPRQLLSRWTLALEARGLITVTPDPRDDRRKLIRPVNPDDGDSLILEIKKILSS